LLLLLLLLQCLCIAATGQPVLIMPSKNRCTALMFLMYRTLIHGVSAPCYWDTSEGVNYMSRYYYRHVNLREVLSKYNPRTAFTA
jgi:hypothetical protein